MTTTDQQRHERCVQLLDPDSDASTTLYVLELAQADYGLYTWPSAPALAQYIWRCRAQFDGKTVLELGAGALKCHKSLTKPLFVSPLPAINQNAPLLDTARDTEHAAALREM